MSSEGLNFIIFFKTSSSSLFNPLKAIALDNLSTASKLLPNKALAVAFPCLSNLVI